MDLVTLTFDLETGMRVASKMGNLVPSLYATDRQTDGRTDGHTKPMLIAPFPMGGA